MTTLLQIIVTAFLLAFVASADADRYHTVNVPVVLEVEQVSNVTEITEYSYNDCQGVPMAMAAANNQMYMGTHKPQASIGVGECGGDVAGSLMFGMKPCNNCPLINGNWAFDENVNGFGLGATFVFK